MVVLHTHSDFVFTAYAITGCAVGYLVFLSLWRYIQSTKKLKALQQK